MIRLSLLSAFSASVLALVACDPSVDYLSAGGGGAPGGAGQPANESGAANLAGADNTSGAPAAAGAGGVVAGSPSIGDAGSAGDPGGGPPRLEILTKDGQVLPNSNDFGIDGEVRKYAADPELLEETHDGNKTCVKGTLVAATNMMYDRYWGGGIQFALKKAPKNGPGVRFDATQHGVAGFRITVEGTTLPSVIRLQYKDIKNTDSYCREVNSTLTKTFDFMIRDALKDCWTAGGKAIAPTELEAVELHIVPPVDKNVSIDFCVTSITVIPTDG